VAGDWKSWRDQYKNAPVRLEITCIRNGLEPWVLTPEVEVNGIILVKRRPGE